eukprot:TRINITY_DN10724_c0_g1_i2.p1 TRINITY_DN10724_c0_g1~~TRINITY_DN10724_c0_g1_i2.p1  ORF type:complete len:373 (-),score=67.55 TRINITY_DN10724_c0_g1_i2:65-1183(-)
MERLIAVSLLLTLLLHTRSKCHETFLSPCRASAETPSLRARVQLKADALDKRQRKVEEEHDGEEYDDIVYPPHGTFPVEVTLPGLYKQEASSHQEIELNWIYTIKNKEPLKFVPKLLRFLSSGRVSKTFRALNQKAVKVQMHNARELEAAEGLSKKDFFDKYGFVLLQHQSKMSARDWVQSGRNLANTTNIESQGEIWANADTPCKRIYAKEAAELLKILFPEAQEIFTPSQGVRRGPPLSANEYTDNTHGVFVHTDYGFSLDDLSNYPRFKFKEQVDKFRTVSSSKGYMLVHMWRPVLPMRRPTRWMPLALLDPNTVSVDDVVSLRAYHDGKLDKAEKNSLPIYHVAFKDPAATEGIERRCSFEYRVGVLL